MAVHEPGSSRVVSDDTLLRYLYPTCSCVFVDAGQVQAGEFAGEFEEGAIRGHLAACNRCGQRVAGYRGLN